MIDARPYFYIIQDTLSTLNDKREKVAKKYAGLRLANNVKASEDLGAIYFTSSETVKPLWKRRHSRFKIVSIEEFDTKEQAIQRELAFLNGLSDIVMADNWYNRSRNPFGASPGILMTSEIREKISIAQKKACQDPEVIKRKSEAGKRLPPMKAESRAKSSETVKRKWVEDPEYRKKCSDGVKELWQDPEYRRKQIEGMLDRKNRPGYTEQLSETAKKVMARPGVREKLRKATNEQFATEESRREHAKVTAIAMERPEIRAKFLLGHQRRSLNYRVRWFKKALALYDFPTPMLDEIGAL